MEIVITSIALALYGIWLIYMLIKEVKIKEGLTEMGVGNRNFGTNALFFTVLVTMMGPGFSLGLGEQAYKYGSIYFIFYLFALLQIFLFSKYFVGKVKPLIDNMEDSKNAISMGDIVDNYFGGKPSKITLGIITLAFNIVIIGVVSLGGGKIISHLYDIDLGLSSLIIALIVALYSSFGGMNIVIKTDKAQGILILIAALFCLYLGLDNMFSDNFDIKWLWNNDNPISPNKMFEIIITMFLGEAFVSVYFIRTMLSKDENAPQKAFKRASIWGIFLFFAFAIASISSHAIDYDSSKNISYFVLAMHSNLSYILLPIMVLGFISVVMSTLDSVLNNGAIVTIKDILYPILNIKKLDSLKDERILYVIIVWMIAFLGVTIALIFDNIFSILMIAYKIWAPTVVYPFAVLILTSKVKRYKWTFINSVIGGIIGFFLVSKIIPLPSILVGILFNALSFHLSEKIFNK